MRSALVALAVLLGEFIPKFDLIMGIIGGTLTGPLIFILPPLFYTKMLQIEHETERNLIRNEMSTHDLSDTELLLKTTNYGTHRILTQKNDDHIVSYTQKFWKILKSECMLSVIVIIFGICATLTSTLMNILDIKSLNQFWSPCIQNISLSYQLIPE